MKNLFTIVCVRARSALLVLQLDLEKPWLLYRPCLWNSRYLSCEYVLIFFCEKFSQVFWLAFFIYQHASTEGVRAVILCPTRELAAQTTRECKKLAKGNKFYIKLLTKKLIRSVDLSKLPCDILISTPLRLSSAIKKRKIDLSRFGLINSIFCIQLYAHFRL